MLPNFVCLCFRFTSISCDERCGLRHRIHVHGEYHHAELIRKAGHGGGDFFVIRKFFECVRNQTMPDFDIYFATRLASVAILAHRSLLENGVPYDIPDFRANFPKALAPLRNVCYNKNVPQVHNTAANGERIIPKVKVIKHEISVSSLPGRQIESRYHQL